MSPMMKMTTKSTTAMMSSVIGYCCCMCNHVIYINEIVSRNCKGLLRAKLENVAYIYIYICQNCVSLDVVNKLITLFNIGNYHMKLLFLNGIAYICLECLFVDVVKK